MNELDKTTQSKIRKIYADYNTKNIEETLCVSCLNKQAKPNHQTCGDIDCIKDYVRANVTPDLDETSWIK